MTSSSTGSLFCCPEQLVTAPGTLISLPDVPHCIQRVRLFTWECRVTTVPCMWEVSSGTAWIVRSQPNLRLETVEESTKAMNQWPSGWDLGFLIFLTKILLVVFVDTRETLHEASWQLLPTAYSEHHGTTVHSAQEILGKAWGPLQLALGLDSSTLTGPALCPSAMPGMTSITKRITNSLEFVAAHHFPLHLPI